jgi:uncharacterized ferritin-like protein (DUF455 family)
MATTAMAMIPMAMTRPILVAPTTVTVPMPMDPLGMAAATAAAVAVMEVTAMVVAMGTAVEMGRTPLSHHWVEEFNALGCSYQPRASHGPCFA